MAPHPNKKFHRQIGIDSFVINTPNLASGGGISTAKRMSNLLAEMECADKAGLDVFGIGEHHRADFADSAPAVILAAAAARTRNIRLTSAVTVLSAHDPVRVFQDYRHARPDIEWSRRDDRRARLVR